MSNNVSKVFKEMNSERHKRIYGSDNIEKSELLNIISCTGNLNLKKSGKELKEHVNNTLIPLLNSELINKKNEITEILKECGNPPTNTPDIWWTNGIDFTDKIGYLVYLWEETCYDDNPRIHSSLSFEDEKEKMGNFSKNSSEANSRRKYNELVRNVCDILLDIKACEILKNLDDNEKYELTPRQFMALKF